MPASSLALLSATSFQRPIMRDPVATLSEEDGKPQTEIVPTDNIMFNQYRAILQ